MPLLAVALGFAACAKSSDPAPTATTATAELRAHPMHGGPHAMHATCALGSGAISEDASQAILRALADERRAEAEYATLGSGRPLVHIARSEHQHAAELEALLRAHGAPVPPPSEVAPPPTTTSAREACALGIASERRNIALYDELLRAPLPADVRCVFERLRAMSAEHHLPAFQRCASGGR